MHWSPERLHDFSIGPNGSTRLGRSGTAARASSWSLFPVLRSSWMAFHCCEFYYPCAIVPNHFFVALCQLRELFPSIRRTGQERLIMQTLRQDISYALRQMRLSPVFTLTAMLTLALGIGATTAIFSLIHTVMLKSLPVVDPSSLYRVGEGNDCCVEGGPQNNWGMYSYQLYQLFQKAAPEFDQLAAFQAG